MTVNPRSQSGYTGAILAGGQSSRMGTPKEGLILWDERPMLQHILDALHSLCDRIIVVGACQGVKLPPDILRIDDIHPGLGPLSALESLLASGLDCRYLVTTCDQPLLSPELLTKLTEGAAPSSLALFRHETGEKPEPFPGLYPDWLLTELQDALRHQRYAVHQLLARPSVSSSICWQTLPETERFRLLNVNTPEVLQELLANKHQAGREAVQA